MGFAGYAGSSVRVRGIRRERPKRLILAASHRRRRRS